MTKFVQILTILALVSVITAEYCYTNLDAELGFGSIKSDESSCGLTYKVNGKITAFKADHTNGFKISVANNTISALRSQNGRTESVSFVWKSEPQHMMIIPTIKDSRKIKRMLHTKFERYTYNINTTEC